MLDCVAEFERHRGRLMALAYRMLGSLSDAEDAVQDASLRLLQANTSEIRSSEAWLVSVTTRLCIDRLRHIETERALLTGPLLPEPILGEAPGTRLELASDMSIALLVVLQQLSPEERAVLILHDILDVCFDEIAATVGKNASACRQIAKRAREHVQHKEARQPAEPRRHQELVERFLDALQSGSQAEIMSVLSPEAVLVTDGGGKFKVARTGIHGSERIGRLIAYGRLVPRPLRPQSHRISRKVMAVNGQPGILTFLADGLMSVLAFDIDDCKIGRIYQVLDPAKLKTPVPSCLKPHIAAAPQLPSAGAQAAAS